MRHPARFVLRILFCIAVAVALCYGGMVLFDRWLGLAVAGGG